MKEIEADERVRVLLNSQVAEALGDSALEALRIHDASTGKTQEVPPDALFVMIGALPHTDWLGPSIARDNRGFVLTGADPWSDDSSRARWPLARLRSCWRRACLAYSRPVTSATVQSSGSPEQLEKEQRRSC